MKNIKLLTVWFLGILCLGFLFWGWLNLIPIICKLAGGTPIPAPSHYMMYASLGIEFFLVTFIMLKREKDYGMDSLKKKLESLKNQKQKMEEQIAALKLEICELENKQ